MRDHGRGPLSSYGLQMSRKVFGRILRDGHPNITYVRCFCEKGSYGERGAFNSQIAITLTILPIGGTLFGSVRPIDYAMLKARPPTKTVLPDDPAA